MPIAAYYSRALLNGYGFGFVRTNCPPDTEPDEFYTNAMASAVHFDVQLVDDIVFNETTRNYDVPSKPETLGAMNLPFAYTWVEWNRGGYAWACLLIQARESDGSLSKQIWAVIHSMPVGDDTPTMHPVVSSINLDDDARLREWKWNHLVWDESARDTLWFHERLLPLAANAIGLMNCRNVRTEQTGKIAIGRSGTQKRRGEKSFELRYNTIILPGNGSVKQGTGPAATHRANALHRVRGHFKTFTPKKPLMGKHVGTYWWGWQLRGSAANGITDSNYALA